MKTVEKVHVHMPKIRVTPERRARYDKALDIVRGRHPDMSLADWMREALDERAERDERRAKR